MEVDVFEQVRPRLFGIAYRMLGTVHDADDVVQDAWLRWNSADRDAVAEPGAYLSTVVTRLSIAALTSARAVRETYVGPWLPEPVDTSAGESRSSTTSTAIDRASARSAPRRGSAEVSTGSGSQGPT